MKNEMIALADYIESESRNNLAAHTTRANHAEFKLSDAVNTKSTYTVTCEPEVEKCQALAKKIRKNAGKSFDSPKRLGYTPIKPAGSLKMALRNLMADKDWAACANLALPQGTPLYVQLKGNNEPLGLYEFVQDHPERNEYVIVKNHVNHVLLSRYYALPLLSGDSAKAVIKQMDDYMQKRKLSWSDVEDQIIRTKPVRHEVALEQLCKNQGQPIDYQALWPTAKAGIKVESPKPKVVKAAKSAPAKPKAKAVSKPVVTSALLMQALAAIPKNYHV